MRIRKYLTQTLLASAVFTSQGLVPAADSPVLSPVTKIQLKSAGDVALRKVPDATETRGAVQQIQYQEDASSPQNSTVNAELQQVFRKNGQPMPSMQTQHLPNVSPRQIHLAQHAEDNTSETAAKRKKKKSGLIRRWFGKLTGGASGDAAADGGEFTGDKDNPYLDSGQQVRKLPTPPPIVYGKTNGSVNGPAKGPVPAQVTGYQSSDGVRPLIQQPANQGSGGYRQPTINQPGSGGYRPSQPSVRKIPRDDGFIDPFQGEGLTHQEETLLDLDSLIDGPAAADVASQNTLRPTTSEAETTLPELSIDIAEPEQPAQESSGGPFTGYRLELEEPVMIQPKIEPVTSNVQNSPPAQTAETPQTVPVQPAPVQPVPVQPEPRQPVLEDTLDLTVPFVEERVSEPATALPPAEFATETEAPEERSFEEIPLLDKPADNPAAEQWQPATEHEEPQLSSAAPEATPPGADRIRALDSRARQEQQRYRIMARAGKTGFKGFCPVTLREQRELIDSREEYRAKFGLQTYYFASPEAKSAFEANPARYAPAAGGSDVVLLVNTGEDTAGALDFSLWYRDRLYMFRSRETQAIFSKDPSRYASQY